MGAFGNASKKLQAPGRTLMLEPWVFADTWERKPSETICVGLRLMSEEDKTKARGEAARFAREIHPDGGEEAIDAFNDTLLRQCVALGICDPNDRRSPCHLLSQAEDQVREALSSRGARFVYDAIAKYEVESSPLNPEADESDLEELVLAIRSGEVEGMVSNGLALRFLRYALDEIRNSR